MSRGHTAALGPASPRGDPSRFRALRPWSRPSARAASTLHLWARPTLLGLPGGFRPLPRPSPCSGAT
eukprot:6585338-Lingulodinium_polyedra.AAC.1